MSSNPSSRQTHPQDEDAASLGSGVADVASRVSEAAKAIRGVGQTVASQVGTAAGSLGDTSSELAASAKEHAKTLTSELESMARRNPLGTIAGALLVGVVVGIMFRGR